MLAPLLSALRTIGPDTQAAAVSKLLDTVLQSDKEIREQLGRIESKIDTLLIQDLEIGISNLSDALEDQRSPSHSRKLIDEAIQNFKRAASGNRSFGLSRSIGALWLGICWLYLGDRRSSVKSVNIALQESYDYIYALAMDFNQPHKAIANLDLPRIQRQGVSAQRRKSLQRRLMPLIVDANQWSRGVASICKELDPTASKSTSVAILILESPRRDVAFEARVVCRLTLGEAVNVAGIEIAFIEAVSVDDDRWDLVDTHVQVSATRAYKDRTYGSKPLEVADRYLRPKEPYVPPPEGRVQLHDGRFGRDGVSFGGSDSESVDGWRRSIVQSNGGLGTILIRKRQNLSDQIMFRYNDARPVIVVHLQGR